MDYLEILSSVFIWLVELSTNNFLSKMAAQYFSPFTIMTFYIQNIPMIVMLP